MQSTHCDDAKRKRPLADEKKITALLALSALGYT